jgi:hypothetical protein
MTITLLNSHMLWSQAVRLSALLALRGILFGAGNRDNKGISDLSLADNDTIYSQIPASLFPAVISTCSPLPAITFARLIVPAVKSCSVFLIIFSFCDR